MLACNYSDLRQNLSKRLDGVHDNREPLLVTRQNGAHAVILDKEEYDGIMETLHLLKSPANAARLIRSIEQANGGELVERDLVE